MISAIILAAGEGKRIGTTNNETINSVLAGILKYPILFSPLDFQLSKILLPN